MAPPIDGAAPRPPPPPPPPQQPANRPAQQPGQAPVQQQQPQRPPVDVAAAQRDAGDLYRAMKGGLTGWGTDEDAIFRTLGNKSPEQMAEIKKQYSTHYKADLTTDLRNELSGNDLQRALNLVNTNQAAATATVLKNNQDAWVGGGGEIMSSLEKATPKERVKIAEEYAAQYGQGQKGNSAITYMTGQLRGKLGAEDNRRLDIMMDAARVANNPELAAKFNAQAGAEKVKTELNSMFGSNDTVFQTIQSMTPEERAVASKNTELVNQLTSKLDGPDRQRALALLRGDAGAGDAAQINTMLNGTFGADTKGIRQLLDGKKPEELNAIRDAFRTQTGKNLDQQVLRQYSGAERNVVSQLLQNGQAAPADRLAMAMEGLGTDEQAIKDVLGGKTRGEIDQIRSDYLTKYKRPLAEDLKSELSGRDDFQVDQLLQGKPETAEQKLQQLEAARDYERGWSSGAIDFVNKVTKGEADGERLDNTLRDARTQLNQVKGNGNASPADQAKLNETLGFGSEDVKTYQETKDSAGETAGTAAVAVVTTAAVIGTGGAATPLAIAGYAALGAGTRMAVQGAVQGQSLGSEGLFQAGVTGAVEGGTAVLPGVGKGAGALKTGATQAAETVVEQQVVRGAEKTVAGRILQGTVEGTKQGVVGGAASGATAQAMQSETWENGVLDAGKQIAGRAVKDGAIGGVFGGAAGGTITAGGEGISALRGKGTPAPANVPERAPTGGTEPAPANVVPERAPAGGTEPAPANQGGVTPEGTQPVRAQGDAPPATQAGGSGTVPKGTTAGTPEERLANVNQALERAAPGLKSATAAEAQAARKEALEGVRTALGDLDTPEAAAVLKGLEGKKLEGLEQGLVAQKGDRLIYVDQNGKLADVKVNAGNAKDVLAGIKAADETLGRTASSYDLRKSVLERSGGDLTSVDAYTYTPPLDEAGKPLSREALREWRMDPANWLPERQAVQKQIYTQGLDRAEALSQLAEPNTLYALRGNTAAGKSTAVKQNAQFKDMAPALDGAINPDTYKFGLRQADAGADGLMTTASKQVHEEGSLIAARIEKEMMSRPNSSLVYDKRFAWPGEMDNLLARADATGKNVKVVDLDAPLDLSAARVLTRTANGDAPLVPFDAVAEGFDGIRKNRGEMLFGKDGNGGLANNPRVKDYELYVVNDQGQPVRVAYKENGVWHDPTPENMPLFEKALSGDTARDLATIKDQVIDQAFIDRMANTAPPQFRDQMRASLEDFRGKTLKQALDAKSTQINDPKLVYLQQAKQNLQVTDGPRP